MFCLLVVPLCALIINLLIPYDAIFSMGIVRPLPARPPPHPTTNTNNNFVYCEVVAYIIAMTLRSVTGCALLLLFSLSRYYDYVTADTTQSA